MPSQISAFLRRQDVEGGDSTAGAEPEVVGCTADTVADSYAQLRIASIFVILVGSLVGAVLPVWLARFQKGRPSRSTRVAFFVAKYFGSGVIVSTAFMHLISPANEILGLECLQPLLMDYDWSMAVVLMTVMVMFFVELLATWLSDRKNTTPTGYNNTDAVSTASRSRADLERGSFNSGGHNGAAKEVQQQDQTDDAVVSSASAPNSSGVPGGTMYAPGGDEHLAHSRTHVPGDGWGGKVTSICILEAGVVLHSIFIGLTLAVNTDFIVLFIVLVFHQTFEGLGLGSRLATVPWPSDWRRFTPWAFALLYGLTTPLSIAVGLGVKGALDDNPTTRFMVEGFSNAISGGVLLYTGLVELMAHEFMFNPEMQRASLGYKLSGFGCMALGAGIMALLAKWA